MLVCEVVSWVVVLARVIFSLGILIRVCPRTLLLVVIGCTPSYSMITLAGLVLQATADTAIAISSARHASPLGRFTHVKLF